MPAEDRQLLAGVVRTLPGESTMTASASRRADRRELRRHEREHERNLAVDGQVRAPGLGRRRPAARRRTSTSAAGCDRSASSAWASSLARMSQRCSSGEALQGRGDVQPDDGRGVVSGQLGERQPRDALGEAGLIVDSQAGSPSRERSGLSSLARRSIQCARLMPPSVTCSAQSARRRRVVLP